MVAPIRYTNTFGCEQSYLKQPYVRTDFIYKPKGSAMLTNIAEEDFPDNFCQFFVTKI